MSTTQHPTSTYPLGYMNGSLPNLQQHNGSIPNTYSYQNGTFFNNMTSGSNGNTFGFRKRMERIDWKKIGNYKLYCKIRHLLCQQFLVNCTLTFICAIVIW